MYLQKLEVQGFKSFADKTTFLFPAPEEDQHGITAVIGPNGSGKSNVADAVRWVLGEQSLKTLRSKRAEDVIFFGSDKKAQRGFCEVSLFFNNDDHVFPLEIAEVVITRRLYRDGNSEYILNKNKVRLSDITLLLAQAHIGQKSYSVIGQGMVDAILHTAPAERKEFFDEAVGVRQYQIKKDQSLQKLKATNENLASAHTVLTELEPKMRFFARQLKRLEERDIIEQELIGRQRGYYNVLWNDLDSRMTGLSKERASVQEKIDVLSEEQHTREALFSIEEKKSGGTEGTTPFSQLQKSLSALQNERQQLLTRASVLESRLQTELTKTGQGHLAWLSQKQQELRDALRSLEEEIKTLQRDIAASHVHVDELQEKLKDALASAGVHQSEEESFQHVSTMIDELLSFDESTLETEGSLDGLRGIVGRVISQIRTLRQYVAERLKRIRTKHTQSDADRIREELRSLQGSLGILQERARLKAEEQKKLQKEYEHVGSELSYFSSSDLSAQHAQAMQEKDGLNSTREGLEKKISAIQSELDGMYEKEKEKSRHLLDLQKEIAVVQKEQERFQQDANRFSLDIARLEAHQEELLGKIFDDLRVEESTRQDILGKTETLYSSFGFSKTPEALNLEQERIEIDRLKRKVEQIGTIDPDVVGEYEESKTRYEFLTNQVKDLEEAQVSLHSAIEELDGIIKEKFEKNLEGISKNFTMYFQQLFDGGTAKLIIQHNKPELAGESEEDGEIDELSPPDSISGIDIEATPPGKRFKSLSFLSGGEKTLTAIALLCAILAQNPSPFVILDEVDAALDESNANRFATIIKELSSQTQFILISHNRVTMHTATVLYGVTMGEDGISNVLSLDIRQLDAIVKA